MLFSLSLSLFSVLLYFCTFCFCISFFIFVIIKKKSKGFGNTNYFQTNASLHKHTHIHTLYLISTHVSMMKKTQFGVWKYLSLKRSVSFYLSNFMHFSWVCITYSIFLHNFPTLFNSHTILSSHDLNCYYYYYFSVW